MSKAKDWRKFFRYKLQLQIVCSFEASDKAHRMNISNIGLGGVFIEADAPEVVDGGEVKFEFDAGNELPISGKGVVVWRRQENTDDLPSGFGLKFTDIDEQASFFLDELIEIIELRKPDSSLL